MQNIYEAASANKRKSFFIVGVFVVFIFAAVYFISSAINVYLGYKPGGFGSVGLALIISGLTSLGSYYFSDKIVLAISRAKKADRKKHFDFYTVAENLSLASGIPQPTLYVIDDTAPNAFATGRNPDHAVICATTGLLDKLSRTELEGVIAHEITHIKNYDILLMSIVSVLVGTVALLGDWLLRMRLFGSKDNDNREGNQLALLFMLLGIFFAILSPIVAQLIRLAISRRREFLADTGSVSITRQPSGLISALKKISSDEEALEVANKATAHLYIVSPFKGKGFGSIGWFSNLFNTHPPIEERIKALTKMI